MELTAQASKGLRPALGTKLDLAVARSPSAASGAATLAFTFNW
jgi:hypothetical protein